MTTQRINTTNYAHPQETNLLNLHKAMEYNTQGQPVIRTTSGASAASNDAFGRLRVSNPFTLYDSFHRYQDNGKAGVFTAGGGTSSHDANSSSILMAVGVAQNDEVIRETSRVFAYQPGKSLQMMISFNMSPAKSGLRQRVGLFDSDNGVYLQLEDDELSIVMRSSSDGSLGETKVVQADWNVDSINGQGINPLVLDITKSQIFWIDMEWLGVGTVRCGFVIDGQFVHCHSFHHANIGTSTYITTACLPGRVEIKNVSATTSPSTYRQICFTVISEGGYEVRGQPRGVGHELQAGAGGSGIIGPYTLAEANTDYPIASIRLKSTRPGAIVIPTNFSIAVLSGANFKFKLLTRAVTSGGTWYSADANSAVEYNLNATAVVSGTTVENGFIAATNQSSVSPTLTKTPFTYQLERNRFTNTFYEFVIVMSTSASNDPNVLAAIDWEEIT